MKNEEWVPKGILTEIVKGSKVATTAFTLVAAQPLDSGTILLV